MRVCVCLCLVHVRMLLFQRPDGELTLEDDLVEASRGS